MTVNNLSVRSITRFPSAGQIDELVFEDGVNVVVGEKDAGKTKWMSMINFLLGYTKPAEEAFAELSGKYESISGKIRIGDELFELERRWREHGSKGKILVNRQAFAANEFSEFILSRIGIPAINFPSGDPFAERAWPALSWGMLFRHLYRRERFWGELVEKQPEAEQYACLLQFLGVAERRFPKEYGILVDKQKTINRLSARRDQFLSVLSRLAQELVPSGDFGAAPTRESIDGAVRSVEAEIELLRQKREQILEAVRAEVEAQNAAVNREFGNLAKARASYAAQHDVALGKLSAAEERLAQLRAHSSLVSHEHERLQRARIAGSVLSELRVTHCPVCDQEIQRSPAHVGECYLCHQPVSQSSSPPETVKARLVFEEEQLAAEKTEIAELLAVVEDDVAVTRLLVAELAGKLATVEGRLQPARTLAAAIMPPHLMETDQEIGQATEKVQQLRRVRSALELRDKLTADVDTLEQEIELLRADRALASASVPYATLEDKLADGMNTYLNAIHRSRPSQWAEREVTVNITKTSYEVFVAGRKIKHLGAASQALVFAAYHYALLSLTDEIGFRCPGFLMLDFPVNLTEKLDVGEAENYVLEPFVQLAQSKSPNVQVIVAGRAFHNLQGAHRIELQHKWF